MIKKRIFYKFKNLEIILFIVLLIECIISLDNINQKILYMNSDKDIKIEKTVGGLYEEYNKNRVQKVHSDYNNLTSIKIKVGTYTRENNDIIKFVLYDKNNKNLREKLIDTSKLKDNDDYEIKFKNLKDSKDKDYYFKLISLKGTATNTITVYSQNDSNDIFFQLGYANLKMKLILWGLCLIFPIIYLLSYFFLKKSMDIKKEKKFLYVVFIYGIMGIFLFLPLQAPDELVHFLRAYSISKGQFVPKRVDSKDVGELPVSLEEFIKDSGFYEVASHPDNKVNLLNFRKINKIKVNKEKTQNFKLEGAAIINPISYIPQSIGIKIGESLNLPLYFVYYLGRIFNFFTWILLVYSAIKISPPKLKNMFFIFSLLPISIQQAMSYSTDALINGFSFLFVAAVFRLYLDNEEKVNIKYRILLFLGVFFPTSIKVVYFLFIIFILLLSKKFSSRKDCLITFFFIFSLTLAFNIFWSKLSPSNPARNISLQIEYLKENPIEYLKTLYITSKILSQYYVESYIGTLGWLDTRIPYLLMCSYIILIMINIYSNNIISRNDLKAKFTISIYLILSYIGILTALYIGWSEVGLEYVDGVQGRYFVPVIPLLYILLSKRRIFVKKDILDFNTEIFMSFGLAMMMFVFLSRYYI
jgi:membrane protein, related to actinobacillus protein (1944168)